MHTEYIEILISSLMSAAFLATFICIFFFTYGKNIEKNVIINNTSFLIDDLTSSFSLLPKDITNLIGNKLSNTKSIDMSALDKSVAKSNNIILTKTIEVLSLFLGIVLISTYILCYFFGINYEVLIVKNLMLLAAIGFVEYIFLTYVGQYYIAVDTNNIKANILKFFQ